MSRDLKLKKVKNITKVLYYIRKDYFRLYKVFLSLIMPEIL
jgi:hypothetical protein